MCDNSARAHLAFCMTCQHAHVLSQVLIIVCSLVRRKALYVTPLLLGTRRLMELETLRTHSDCTNPVRERPRWPFRLSPSVIVAIRLWQG